MRPSWPRARPGSLVAAGFDARIDGHSGIDHLSAAAPDVPAGDIPVVALSVNPAQTAAWHYRLDRALAPLRDEGVLVVGSGGFSHNLRELDWQHDDAPAYPWVEAFTAALRGKLLAGDVEGALDWQTLPEARRNHPTTEYLPALCGAGRRRLQRPRHATASAVQMGGMAMDAFAFD